MHNRFITKALSAVVVAVVALITAGQAKAQTVTQTGSWFNTTFSSQGDLEIEFSLSPTTYDFTVDPDGFVFGVQNPDPVNVSGNRELDGSVILNDSDPFFGDISGTITATGELQNVTFSNIPTPGIFNMTVEGDIGLTDSSGTYVVNFNDPATRGGAGIEGSDFAEGTWATAVPEPTSLALLGLGGLLVARRRRG